MSFESEIKTLSASLAMINLVLKNSNVFTVSADTTEDERVKSLPSVCLSLGM